MLNTDLSSYCGPDTLVTSFSYGTALTYLNTNDRNIVLTYEYSQTKIIFLDLEIELCARQFRFSTYFKQTDYKGCIPSDNCHHKSWLHSVSKSQFLRLRMNCANLDTFKNQANVLRQRFLDKGYDQGEVNLDLSRVLQIERSALLVDKPRRDPDESLKWSVLTSFSVQHKQIKSIIEHHWNVLRKDRILGTLLPERAKVTYRGAPSLRSKIALNVINPPVRTSFFHNLIGYYPCKKCTVCQHNTCGRRVMKQFSSTITKGTNLIKHFCTCITTGVVYLITCPCGKQYVGRTVRSCAIRVGEHIAKIKNGNIKRTVPRH